MSALDTFLAITETEFNTFLKSIREEPLREAAQIIWDAQDKGGGSISPVSVSRLMWRPIWRH